MAKQKDNPKKEAKKIKRLRQQLDQQKAKKLRTQD